MVAMKIFLDLISNCEDPEIVKAVGANESVFFE